MRSNSNKIKIGFLILSTSLIACKSFASNTYRHIYNGSGSTWGISGAGTNGSNLYIQCPADTGENVKNPPDAQQVKILPGMKCNITVSSSGGVNSTYVNIDNMSVNDSIWCTYNATNDIYGGSYAFQNIGNSGPGIYLNRYPNNWRDGTIFNNDSPQSPNNTPPAMSTGNGDITMTGSYIPYGGSCPSY